ncbi:MAG: CoA ester lyase [Chloroflexota bacterium]
MPKQQDSQQIVPRRSFLFAPGTAPHMFPKAIAAKPDIMCVDLEDAIAPQHKVESRQQTFAWFNEFLADDAGLGSTGTEVELLVRINSLRSADGMADVLMLLEQENPPPGLMLPKVKSPDEIKLLDDLLTDEGKDTRFQVIIETNEALEACFEIARASDRIVSLLFGGVDMAAELRVEPTWEPLLYARKRLVHAAASAQIDLIDVPFLDLNDMEGLDEEARRCAEIGMTGKGAIHPKQLPVITKHFTPSAEAVAHAKRVLQAFEEAGTGLVVLDGKLIEKPVLRNMQRLLAIAERMGEGDGA